MQIDLASKKRKGKRYKKVSIIKRISLFAELSVLTFGFHTKSLIRYHLIQPLHLFVIWWTNRLFQCLSRIWSSLTWLNIVIRFSESCLMLLLVNIIIHLVCSHFIVPFTKAYLMKNKRLLLSSVNVITFGLPKMITLSGFYCNLLRR